MLYWTREDNHEAVRQHTAFLLVFLLRRIKTAGDETPAVCVKSCGPFNSSPGPIYVQVPVTHVHIAHPVRSERRSVFFPGTLPR